MFRAYRKLIPLDDRGPLRVMFLITSMPVGGAETLLVELVRRLDRSRFAPELCCLRELGPLAEQLSGEIPVFSRLLGCKYDVRVLGRLAKLLRRRRIDAVVTVGAGDKMFWGRLAARRARVPVILSALHSTGHPDRVGRLNRMLAPITDAFIAVAESQGHYLAEREGCPAAKIRVIPNGVDLDRFSPREPSGVLRAEFDLPEGAPTAGIVASLRPEKHHELFLKVASRVHEEMPDARFLIVGDGPERARLERLVREMSLCDAVRFLGSRSDVAEVLAVVDVLLLTSHIEASPVSILEAMATGKPVVATRVGSVPEHVLEGQTGFLVEPGHVEPMAHRVLELFQDRGRAATMGSAARDHVVAQGSVERMVEGYQELIRGIYTIKCSPQTKDAQAAPVAVTEAAGPR